MQMVGGFEFVFLKLKTLKNLKKRYCFYCLYSTHKWNKISSIQGERTLNSNLTGTSELKVTLDFSGCGEANPID
jgi:hypothetical protein